MKKSTNVVLATSFLFLVSCLTATAQTNVSGGIYANTTWTLANSPYIVTDTVVVFPGDTLTIEPGVTVEFADGKYMEIRQATLIAAGTVGDSITFTSNSISPTMGIYTGILFTNAVAITIDYCRFGYADKTLNLQSSSNDTLVIQNSYFYMNNNCIQNNSPIIIKQTTFYDNNNCIPQASYPLYIKNTAFYSNNFCLGEPGIGVNCFLDSCIFMNNPFGVLATSFGLGHGTVTNCIFNNNGKALYIDDQTNLTVNNSIFCNNTLGILMFGNQSYDTLTNCNFSLNHIAISGPSVYMSGNILTDNDTACFGLATDSMFNNYIFHNEVGILYSGYPPTAFFNNYICNNSYNINYTSSSNGSIPPVCFCDTDSATIRSKIYDGYVNIARGLLNFTPFVSCDSSVITALPPINCQAVVLTGIDEPSIHSLIGTFEVFPNPASDNITLNLSKDILKAQFKIFNMLGELKYSSVVSSQQTNVDVSVFTNGVYIVEVITENNILRQKFIKQ